MSSIQIDGSKNIIIEGKKTFPVGMWGISNQWDTTTGGEPATTSLSKLTNFIFQVSSIITGTTYPIQDAATIVIFENAGMYWTADPRQTTLLDSPHFFGWLHWQEPEDFNQWWTTCPVNDYVCQKTFMKNLYNEMKTKSNHPVLLPIMGKMFPASPSSIKYWQDSADILVTDGWESFLAKYPKDSIIFRYEQTHIDTLFYDIAGNPDNLTKPFFLGIVGVGKTGNFQLLNEKQLRLHNYVAITMGASGIVYWGYKIWLQSTVQWGIQINPTQTTIYDHQAAELKQLNDILVLPTVGRRWQGDQSGTTIRFSSNSIYKTSFDYWGTTLSQDNWNWILKSDSVTGNKYAIIINKGMQSVTPTITIPGIGNTNIITLGNQTIGTGRAGRTLNIINDVFTDIFEPQAVHIYQININNSCPPSQCNFTINQ